MDIDLRRSWLRTEQSRKRLYQKGVLFIRDAQEGEGPTVRAGMGACALEGSGTKPSLVGSGASLAQLASYARNLRGAQD